MKKGIMLFAVLAIVIFFFSNVQVQAAEKNTESAAVKTASSENANDVEKTYLLIWHFYYNEACLISETDIIKAKQKDIKKNVDNSRHEMKKKYFEVEYTIVLQQILPL